MNRTAVNPWEWSLQFGFNQAETVEGHSRVLVCAGQTAIDGDGSPQHAGDMAAQLTLALDNLEARRRPPGVSRAHGRTRGDGHGLTGGPITAVSPPDQG